MATDGVKIIDGDLAHDVYSTFMEMYDAGASIQEIKAAVEQPFDAEDGFDYEIYITVYALALWQTGQLTQDIIAEVDEAIARGAGVKVWQDENGAKEGQKRQRELEKLREKLSTPNPKPRKRRIYKLVTKFIFEENTVLTFQLPDGAYRAAILMEVFQHQGRSEYRFLASTYAATSKPNIAEISNVEVLGRKIPSGFGQYKTGLDVVAIGPKLLRSFADKFESIGKIELRSESKYVGAYSGARDFESFCWNWLNTALYIKNLGGTAIPLNELI
ncbi:hypothetical protein [Hymenobacter armeniacus]|uniref:Uncharacterized protein n=1 Tax=Hymenobacter armeniacus TaxID=2771358 RepID=A0ABR8JTW7_9BACT|nr:hypothetical protein [Hymenobacter armeniacus]MBD2721394.1 hypothetical protein [Hymenobacter armeniacus]